MGTKACILRYPEYICKITILRSTFARFPRNLNPANIYNIARKFEITGSSISAD